MVEQCRQTLQSILDSVETIWCQAVHQNRVDNLLKLHQNLCVLATGVNQPLDRSDTTDRGQSGFPIVLFTVDLNKALVLPHKLLANLNGIRTHLLSVFGHDCLECVQQSFTVKLANLL